MGTRKLGYEVTSRMMMGQPQTIARFQCPCGVSHTQTLTKHSPPEKVAKRAAQDGWKVDAFAASVTRCPSCQAGSRPALAPEPPPTTRPPGPVSGIITTRDTLPAHLRSDADRVADLMDAQDRAPMPAAVVAPPNLRPAQVPPAFVPALAAAVTAPGLTSAQRLAVRNMLDTWFDDATGAYLDGYSDGRIAQELSLDKAHVARLREAAYGPLKVQVDTAAQAERIAQLERQVEMLARRLDGLAARQDAPQHNARPAVNGWHGGPDRH